MIQANELRVNNYVFSKKHKGLITQIHSSVFPTGVKLWANPLASFYKLKDIDPIPLTEELLLKCPEFKPCLWSTDFRVDLRYDNAQFHLVKHKGKFLFRGLGMSIVFVETLHHLQNLVFVNTLKELEVTL